MISQDFNVTYPSFLFELNFTPPITITKYSSTIQTLCINLGLNNSNNSLFLTSYGRKCSFNATTSPVGTYSSFTIVAPPIKKKAGKRICLGTS